MVRKMRSTVNTRNIPPTSAVGHCLCEDFIISSCKCASEGIRTNSEMASLHGPPFGQIAPRFASVLRLVIRRERARPSVRKLNLSNTEDGDLKIQHLCGFSSLAFGEVSNTWFPAFATTMIVMPVHDYSRIAHHRRPGSVIGITRISRRTDFVNVFVNVMQFCECRPLDLSSHVLGLK